MPTYRFVSIVLTLLLLGPLKADHLNAAERLVRNINTSDDGSSSDPQLFPVAGAGFFLARGDDQLDLWRSDGTAEGTAILAPALFAAADPRRAVIAGDDTEVLLGHPDVAGIWRFDGTPQGLARIDADGRLEAAAVASDPESILFVARHPDSRTSLQRLARATGQVTRLATVLDGDPQASTAFAFGRAGGRDLLAVSRAVGRNGGIWTTDGTPRGTALMAEIDLLPRVVSGPVAVFFERRGPTGIDAWRTDGTSAGTREIGALQGLSVASLGEREARLGHRVVTMVRDNTSGISLQVIDLETETVTRLLGLARGRVPDAYVAESLHPIGARAVFVGGRGPIDLEPWITDGTAAGTRRLANLCVDRCSSFPTLGIANGVVRQDDRLIFAAVDRDGPRLWSVDGSETPPIDLGALPLSSLSNRDFALLPLDRTRHIVRTRLGLTLVGEDLESPRQLFEGRLSLAGSPRSTLGFDGRLLFVADAERSGFEPWTSDGTPAGTALVANVLRGDASSSPHQLTAIGNELLFFVIDDEFDRRLWRSDGTEAGTVAFGTGMVGDPRSSVLESRVVGDRLYFAASTEEGEALWTVTDLDSPPVRLTPFSPFNGFPFPGTPPNLILPESGDLGDRLVFIRESELWVSEGTPEGTFRLTPNGVSASLGGPRGADARSGDTLFFRGSGALGSFLWATDGTIAGTRVVTSASGSRLDGFFEFHAPVQGHLSLLRLVADAIEIWFTDGTPEGTTRSGEFEIFPWIHTSTRQALFYSVMSDSGTSLFAVAPGESPRRLEDPNPHDYVPFPTLGGEGTARRAFFRRGDGTVLVSDGTPDGTSVVPGIAESATGLVVDDELYFADGDFKRTSGDGILVLAPDHVRFQRENVRSVDDLTLVPLERDDGRIDYWRTDGTATGTFPITHFALDPASAFPSELTAAGDLLFMSAQREASGRELWAVPRSDLDDAARLRLRADDRFEITVRWTKPNGESGQGTPRRLTSDTGYFYFFRASNAELMIKILDGRDINDHFWVFYGALSNLRYEITVTDTRTGAVKTYENPADTFASVGDIRAFPEIDGSSGSTARPPAPPESAGSEIDGGKVTGGCATTEGDLCLQQSRFTIAVTWEKPNGERGAGRARALTSDSGYFYFFRESNIELMIKILDGRSANGHFWVFYGALSNLRYEITVTDTETGEIKTYTNPQGQFSSVGDTRAFEAPL